MRKALAIGLAAVMAVSMSAPVFASDDSEGGAGIAKEDLKIGAIYIGDEGCHFTGPVALRRNLSIVLPYYFCYSEVIMSFYRHDNLKSILISSTYMPL